MGTKDIKFSFWNYAPSECIYPGAVKDWLKIGSNLPMSFIYDPRSGAKAAMLKLLDETAAAGLQMLISDTRTTFQEYQRVGAMAFRKGVRDAYSDFGRHRATYGFFIGDEPDLESIEDYEEASRIVREEMPGLVPFGNLVAYFGGSDCMMDLGRNENFCVDLVRDLLGKSKSLAIGYDQYCQCLQEGENQEDGINLYFHNLDAMNALCKERDIPFYISLLSVGHWHQRVPTEDDIRWQMNTALAHGARGILWFYFYQPKYEPSFRNGPFYGKDFEKTAMFDAIARQQTNFNHVFLTQFNKMELVSVAHLGHFYDPAHRMSLDAYLKDVSTGRRLPLSFSYFREFESGKMWLCVLNLSQRLSNRVTLTFTSNNSWTAYLGPGELALIDLSEICPLNKSKADKKAEGGTY